MEISHILEQIGREKGIDKNTLIDVVKSAVLSASKKRFKQPVDMEVVYNEPTGELNLFINKKVVENIADEGREITLDDATKLYPDVKLNDSIKVSYEIEEFGRISAQIVKQFIFQQLREKEKDAIFYEFKEKINTILVGAVSFYERGDIIVDFGKVEGIIPRNEQSFREEFRHGERIKAYLIDVIRSTKGPQLILSRTHPGLLIRLFEDEVPEIQEGIIEIKGAVREPSGRSKIAVYSKDKDVDAVGACVGMRGVRVQSIVQELRGEKIDIVEWSSDSTKFVSKALSPAKILSINVNEKENQMEIVVPDDQLSLAIGKKGQNVRLAAKLTRWKIDVKSESEYKKQKEAKLDFIEAKLQGIQSNGVKDSTLPLGTILKQVNGLSDKVISLLSAHDYTSVEDIVEKGVLRLLEIEGIGTKKAEKIIQAIKDYLAQQQNARDLTSLEPNKDKQDKGVVSQ